MQHTEYDVIILGAGASGLSAAAVASARGRRVLVLDHAARPAIKVLLAGGGKANFTNRNMGEGYYHSANPQFVLSALQRFSPEDAIEWVREAGIAIEEREHGQMFCARSAKDLCRLLMDSCQNCTVSLNETIGKVGKSGELFSVATKTDTYTAPSLVIALGSKASPQSGATGLGVQLARQFGHRILEPQPALVGLVMSPDWRLAGMEGISLPACIGIPKGKNPLSFTLPLLFTHAGISGPAVLQISLYWQPGEQLLCNFLPEHNLEDLFAAPENGKLLLKNLLKRVLPERLALRFCDIVGYECADTKVAELPRAIKIPLQKHVHNAILIPAGYEGFAKAEVTSGGVSTDQIQSKTMESNLVPGLFFCGEVMDVTGRVGGYNLHWAFASGRAAGDWA